MDTIRYKVGVFGNGMNINPHRAAWLAFWRDRLSGRLLRSGKGRTIGFSSIFLILLASLASPRAFCVDGVEPPDSSGAVLEMTLADSILLALDNNRSLINASLQRVVQKLSLEFAEDKFWPNMNITPYIDYSVMGSSGDQERTASGVTTGVTLKVPTGAELSAISTNTVDSISAEKHRALLTLSFRQPLLKGGGIAVNTASLELARRAEEANILALRSAVMGAVSLVIQTYRNYMQAHQRLEISARSLERAKEQLEVNRLLIDAGRMAERDIVQTETDIANRELGVTEAENSLDAARLSLIDVLDIDGSTRIIPTEELLANPVDPDSLDLERSVELALRSRPDYLSARLRIEDAETELLLARNNRLWDLSATATADFGGSGDSFEPFRSVGSGDYRVGLDLSIPFGDLTLRHRVVRARTALAQARNDLAELRQRVEIAVLNDVREVEVRYRQVDLARRTRELSEQQFEIEKEKLKLGLSTNFQVSNYEEDLVQARNGEVDSVVAYLNALTSLDQTLGTTLETWKVDIKDMGG